jgi:hypothetical protein
MKTTKQTITRNIYVFAEAKTKYQLKNLAPGELPFDYKLKAYDYGDESCVRIMEQPISVVIPEGIDITLECVKNLQEKIDAIRKDSAERIKELEERIRNLTLIEYRPVNDGDDSSDGDVDLEGEYFADGDRDNRESPY